MIRSQRWWTLTSHENFKSLENVLKKARWTDTVRVKQDINLTVSDWDLSKKWPTYWLKNFTHVIKGMSSETFKIIWQQWNEMKASLQEIHPGTIAISADVVLSGGTSPGKFGASGLLPDNSLSKGKKKNSCESSGSSWWRRHLSPPQKSEWSEKKARETLIVMFGKETDLSLNRSHRLRSTAYDRDQSTAEESWQDEDSTQTLFSPWHTSGKGKCSKWTPHWRSSPKEQKKEGDWEKLIL